MFMWCLILSIQALPAPCKLNRVKVHSWAWKLIICTVESLEWSQNSFLLGQVGFSPSSSYLDSVDQGPFLAGKLSTSTLFYMAKGVYVYAPRQLHVSWPAAGTFCNTDIASGYKLTPSFCSVLYIQQTFIICPSMVHINGSPSNASYLTKQGFLASRKGNLNLVSLLDVFSMGSCSPFHCDTEVKRVAATPMLQGCMQQQ